MICTYCWCNSDSVISNTMVQNRFWRWYTLFTFSCIVNSISDSTTQYQKQNNAVSTTEQGEQRVSKSLIDHFSTSNSKFILDADLLETGMVNHYLVYGIRKINAWRIKQKRVMPKIVESRTTKKYDQANFQHDALFYQRIANCYRDFICFVTKH